MTAIRFPAASLLVLALLPSAPPSRAADEASAHRPGLRDQWQPQTEHDARLAQPVRIEILGRAAVPALQLLTKETGVALQVAPEDRETVGDRKLTIIAQGCSLKSIMVQVPNALQECHWDVAVQEKEPVYLLHRNGGAEATMAELAEAETRDYQEALRPEREERMAAARKALAMSPEELAELAKSDPLLAAAVKDAEMREQMEMLFSLPPEAIRELNDRGYVTVSYGGAPEPLQQGCRQIMQRNVDFERGKQGGADQWMTDTFTYGLHHPANVSFAYRSAYGPPMRGGTWMGVNIFRPDGGYIGFASASVVAIPPKAPDSREYELKQYRELLVRTGIADQKAAETIIAELARKQDQVEKEAQERTRALEHREPRSPELHREAALTFEGEVDPIEVQRYIAQQTGLSLVSDYFTGWGGREVPEEARKSMPIWQLLYALGDRWFWSYDWNEAGDCLVFHDKQWFRRVPEEIPESLLTAVRAKLQQQGHLALEDVIAAALELERRRPSPPTRRQRGLSIPDDLRRAGLTEPSEGLLIYASLTPEQQAKARSAEGLAYTEMTPRQQELVRRSSTTGPDERALPDGQMEKAVYRIRQRVEAERSGRRLIYEIPIEFPTRTIRSGVSLDAPNEAPPARP